jgi:predicted PurR-regulated permease PerM
MGDLLVAIRRHRVALFVLAIGVILAWLLWTARGALPAFLIAVALAFVLDPVVTFLQRRRVPRWAGVLVAYAAVVALVWGFVALAIPPLAQQSREFIDHLPQLGAAVTNLQRDFLDWYRSLPLPPELRSMLDDSIASANQAFLDALRQLLGPTVSAVLRTAVFVLGLVVIPVWLFFVLKDRERIPAALRGALPESWSADADNVLRLLSLTGGRWVRGQLLLGAAIFLATLVGITALTIAGFSEFGRFTLVLAAIAGVLEWFPIIGPILSAVPAILIGLTISPAAGLAAVILYAAIQQLENNLLVPKVMGDAVELHPAVLIVALVVGGAMFGLWGALLAAPTLAIARDLYRYTFQRLHDRPPDVAFAAAMGGRGPAPPAPGSPAQPAQVEESAHGDADGGDAAGEVSTA